MLATTFFANYNAIEICVCRAKEVLKHSLNFGSFNGSTGFTEKFHGWFGLKDAAKFQLNFNLI